MYLNRNIYEDTHITMDQVSSIRDHDSKFGTNCFYTVSILSEFCGEFPSRNSLRDAAESDRITKKEMVEMLDELESCFPLVYNEFYNLYRSRMDLDYFYGDGKDDVEDEDDEESSIESEPLPNSREDSIVSEPSVIEDQQLLDWLGKDNQVGIDIWHRKYQQNGESFEEWVNRVSGGDEKVAGMIKRREFLFGGRILAGRGLDEVKASLFNCYVLPAPEDNIGSIFKTAGDMAKTYARGGGVGISLDKLRPRGAKVNNAAKESTGAVSFMDLFSQVTGTIAQNGRRGALMLMLSVEHPDIMEFIESKLDLDKVNFANISVKLTDKFMFAVWLDKPWITRFTNEETGEVIERTYQAREILLSIAECSWDVGDPGVVFIDRMNNWNLLEHNPEYVIESTNPCGEQGLPDYGCCNLGAINLAAFVDLDDSNSATFNYDRFKEAVKTAVIALDTVIDEGLSKHALEEQREVAEKWRNIGLGIMGYADALIMLEIKYGSFEATNFIDNVFKTMYETAIRASVDLAILKGKYLACNSEEIINSSFYKNLDLSSDETFTNLLKAYGMRNSVLTTIAPTGTISTMLGISGGCEPLYAKSYTRTTKSLFGKDVDYVVYPSIVKHVIDRNGIDNEPLPDFVMTAHDIEPLDRVLTQERMQRYIDASISSTVNLPESATVDDIYQLYIDAWENGLKGITIFRDKCRKAGILNITSEKNETVIEEKIPETSRIEGAKSVDSTINLSRGYVIETSDDLIGLKTKLVTGCGSLHLEAFFDPKTGNLLETFASKGSTGGCNNYMVASSRLISAACRGGVPLDVILDQLGSCGACPSYVARKKEKGDTSPGTCCASAIGIALNDMSEKFQTLRNQGINAFLALSNDKTKTNENVNLSVTPQTGVQTAPQSVTQTKSSLLSCPDCGHEMSFSCGCTLCQYCGYSKCD